MEHEPARTALLSVRETKGRDQRHLEAHVPRRSPGQKLSLLVGRQLGDTFEIQFYARQQRRAGLWKRRSVRGDIKICADRMPHAAVPAGVTAQRKGHFSVPWFALLKHSMRYRQGTTFAADVRSTSDLPDLGSFLEELD